jgi:YD repeat-containing protein
VTRYVYDSKDNPTCVTDQRGKKTAYSYDSRGNVTQVIDANNTDVNCQLKSGGVVWTFAYTPTNDLDLATDPLGRQTDYVYDASGNLTRVIRKDPGGAVKALTCLERDGAGQVTALVESTDLQVPPQPTDTCTGNKTTIGYDHMVWPILIPASRPRARPTRP